ncbi:calcium-binding protein [Noviherbaspirillum sp.]|uniref:calcium-binding protein n=1 Tax=Noviherbaspirillum sp. TaxID=1926288 RepID=UPI002B470912|nr:calcium-binding protein [Noviherbaspirillum sp.]HJV81887.1 calcium-binding protein [Noviherbaspirillum sp.]
MIKVESLKTNSYFDGSSIAIGIGYDLLQHSNTEIESDLGLTLTAMQAQMLNEARKATVTRRQEIAASLNVTITEDAAKNSFATKVAPQYEARLDRLLGISVPNSIERIALFSMLYNGRLQDYKKNSSAPRILTELTRALSSGNRAEAWYDIRYLGAFAQNPIYANGYAKRAYFESQYFGLYDNPNAYTDANLVSPDEAKQIYRMFQLHRTHIDKHEQLYGSQAGVADVDYGLGGTSNAVQGLINSLVSAETAIIADLRTQYTSLSNLDPNNYTSTNIYLDPGRNSTSQIFDATHNAILDGSNDSFDKVNTSPEILIGEDGDDKLIGGTGADILLGGDGKDTLTGGLGADTLIGGVGDDTYVFNVGDDPSQDKIIDTQGTNKIVVNGKNSSADFTIAGFFIQDSTQSNVWKSADGKITLTHNSPYKIVLENGETIQLGENLDDFHDGDYGIHLKDAIADTTTRTITGDKSSDSYDDLDNPTGSPTPGSNDRLQGSIAGDRVQGLDGNDKVWGAWTGFVIVDNSLVFTSQDTGDDILEGGNGSDLIGGWGGNDRIYANAEIDLALAIEQGQTQEGTGLKGDCLYGGDGDDIVVGDSGNDALFGAAGADILVGGGGDDFIDGDDNYVSDDFDWQIAESSNPFDRLLSGFHNLNLPGFRDQAAGDVMYGGAGNDFMAGYDGEDILYGEVGNDVMAGDDSDDMLFGGDGDDKMTGDYGSTVYDSGSGAVIQGNDYLDGGAGNDFMQGEGGDDQLFGGGDDDEVWGDTSTDSSLTGGNDYLDGEDGNDKLMGQGGDDELFGGAGNDQLFGDSDQTPVSQQGNDYLDGEDGDDMLRGYGGNDEMFGGAGKDALQGGEGDDYLDGEEGEDTLDGGAGADVLTGGDDADQISAGSGDDALDGGSGNDLMFGEAGNDVVDGGDGNDQAGGGDGDDQLSGGAGSDTLLGDAGNDALFGGDDDDQLQGGEGSDQLFGDAGNDGLLGESGDDTLDGGDGDDQLVGGDGRDYLEGGYGNDVLFGESGDDQLNGGSGNDQLVAGAGQDLLYGGDGDDFLFGDDGDDVLQDGIGNNQLQGGSGNDQLIGGAGNDQFFGDDGDDTLDGGGGADYLNGGDGNDTYILHEDPNNPQTLVDDAGGKNRLVFGAGKTAADITFVTIPKNKTDFILRYGSSEVYVKDGLTHEAISSLAFSDGQTLTRTQFMALAPALEVVGGDSADDILGGGQGDNLSGGAGGDRIAGGAGADTLDGGVGSDTYAFNLGDGQDQITHKVLDNVDDVDTIELGTGISAADVTLIRSGIDLIIKVSATDTMTIKSYYGASATKNEQIKFADGTIWGKAEISANLLSQSATAGNDIINGFESDDIMHGLDGNDSIYGGAGNDQIYGDAGADVLDGGSGNDIFDGGTGNDTIYGGVGNDTYYFGRGSGQDTIWEYASQTTDIDTVIMAADIKPSDVGLLRILNQDAYPRPNDLAIGIKRANGLSGFDDFILVKDFFARQDGYSRIEQIQFADGTIWDAATINSMTASPITEANNTVLGYAWDDNLDGLGGDDTIYGMEGNDSLYGGSGNDHLDSDVGNDVLVGGDGADKLDAGQGDDTLDGGTGRDTLNGGLGNDTYIFGRGYGSDQLGDDSGASGSFDTLQLGADVAPDDVALFRQDSDLVLSVVGSQDQLWIKGFFTTSSGGAPVDLKVEQICFSDGTTWDLNTILAKVVPSPANAMTGTAGNDTFVVDNVQDTVSEGANQGIDTIQSSVSFTASANVENLTLTGALDITGNGNGLNNVIRGNSGHNVLGGGTGADTLYGGGGDDSLSGGGGWNDNAVDTLYGEDGNDTLSEDTSGGGYDLMYGGKGDDTYNFDFRYYPLTNPERIIELNGEGTDTIIARGGIIPDNVENMIVKTKDDFSTTPYVTGNVLDNYIEIRMPFATADYRLDGGAGADTMVGGNGNETYIVDNVGDQVIETSTASSSNRDTVESYVDYALGAAVENLVLRGNASSNGTGNDLNNILNGSAHRDPSAGSFWGTDNFIANVLTGGKGNDVYILGDGDTVVEQADEGIDTVKIAPDAAIRGDYSLASYANVENLELTGIARDSNATGNDGNNSLTGNGYDNSLHGGAGDDSISGNDGNDVIEGGTGNDSLFGGLGNDTYLFGRGDGQDVILDSDAPGGVGKLVFKAGISAGDLVLSRASSDSSNYDNLLINFSGSSDQIVVKYHFSNLSTIPVSSYALEQIEFADGTFWNSVAIQTRLNSNTNFPTPMDDVIGGNNAADALNGLEGNDVVSGGAGDDTVAGGAGNDTLFGNVGSDTLSGDDGDDLLVGNMGDDTLDGGAGNDELRGGDGNDVYRLGRGSGHDRIVESGMVAGQINSILLEPDVLPSDISVVREGYSDDLVVKITGTSDQITISGFFADPLNEIQRVMFADGTQWDNATLRKMAQTINGTAADDTLEGTADDNFLYGYAGNDGLNGYEGNDVLDGGVGADSMFGGAGDDTYVVDSGTDVIVEYAGEGTDTVLSSVTMTLGANVENLTLTGNSAINGTGNALANVLVGNSANNTLDGGTGTDTMSGGAGDDTYIVNVTGDVVTENADEGIDLVKSSATYTLSANVENLTLTGTSAINGTGNALSNVLTGNSAVNTLTGGAGNDTLNGGAGADKMFGGADDDVYVVDNTSDAITENVGEGTDLVQSRVTYTLSANVENLILTGTSAISGTGNALDNVLTGNSAANTLTGGAGNDTLNGGSGADKMLGGTGNDVYFVDNSSDTVTENANAGIDQVQSSITYTLGTNVEALTLTGATAINGTGNAINNLLIGNSANNTLDGGTGTDILQGADGTDTVKDAAGNNLLDGGAGNDTITGGTGREFIIGGSGNDTITTNSGADVIAFNLGDGQDIVNASTTKDNTVSLGKGIRYADLQFKKSSNDLILVTGTSEQITFKDWYLSTTNHSVANLQMVIEGTTDYDAASANQLNNKKIVDFDFDGLATKFEQARAANPSLTSWALSSSLLNFYLSGSDTAAIGGDLAYQYAKNGNLSSFSMTPAQALLSSTQFGTASQSLQSVSALQDSSPRLM